MTNIIETKHWGNYCLQSHQFDIEHLAYQIKAESLNELLHVLYRQGVDDVVFQTDSPVFCKLHGQFIAVTNESVNVDMIRDILSLTHRESSYAKVQGGAPLDYAYAFSVRDEQTRKVNYIRWRANATACQGLNNSKEGMDITMRSIPPYPKTIEQLGIDPVVLEDAFPKTGLVLISGETGSGKTNTLGAFIRRLATTDKTIRIVTYEDPVEFDYRAIPDLKSSVSQTSVGEGEMIETWEACIPNALRRNPDVILLGEVRTRESIKNLITAARSGHLVYSTVHADSVPATINRLVNVFPEDEQNAILEGLLATTQMIIHQRLVKAQSEGRVLLMEHLALDQQNRDLLLSADSSDVFMSLKNLVQENGQPLLTDLKEKQAKIDPDEYHILEQTIG